MQFTTYPCFLHFLKDKSGGLKLIDMAKERMSDSGKSLSEIAYSLGFKYPQHFTRMFRQNVGMSPLEYRSSMN